MKHGKKTGLIKFDIEYVRALGPCYGPERFLVKDKRYDAVQILRDERVPFPDRLWVVLRTGLASERLMRLFAVWSARQVQNLMKDPASHNALDAVELFVDGLIDDAAWAAAGDAAWAAAGDAAGTVAWDAAGDAAWAAAGDAAWAAAGDAAGTAAGDAARDAARARQCEKLIEMFLVEGRERLAEKVTK